VKVPGNDVDRQDFDAHAGRAGPGREKWSLTVTDLDGIVHEHTSAPIGFTHLKAILERKNST
jgi:hypothetical protein